MIASPPEQVYLKGDGTGLHLHLPETQLPWSEVWQQVSVRLSNHPLPTLGGQSHGMLLTLWSHHWPLETQQLQAIAAVASRRNLGLHRVQTNQLQTAIAAVQLGYSVEQTPPVAPYPHIGDYANPLYLVKPVRSGTSIRHQGSIVVSGDVNPGGELAAGGDILVWGRLRGIAHAGINDSVVNGSAPATIMALSLEATQLRIADRVARAPEGTLPFPNPEVAYLSEGAICIASVSEYLRRTV